ncbi:MAG: DUF262 domain-containing protein, partial [Bacteroidetes bacterium]|nr:DUF262 domain-containing protein [Bacteroidota bacterium]
MTKTNVLYPGTINYQDLIGNGKSFSLPPYHRDYSWFEEQWENLWNGILELRSIGSQEHHFMGTLVIHEQRNWGFRVI